MFAVQHRDQGYISSTQFCEYQKLWSAVEALHLPAPHLTILLYVSDPTVCLQRMVTSETRSRDLRFKDDQQLAQSYLHQVDALIKQRWLRDLPSVFTPRWLHSERVPVEAAGIPPAPSLMVLVRDWSDLSNVKAKVVADAVMCTEPIDFSAWIAPYQAEGNDAHVKELLEGSPVDLS